jgi:hypothetical protein
MYFSTWLVASASNRLAIKRVLTLYGVLVPMSLNKASEATKAAHFSAALMNFCLVLKAQT